MTTAIRNAMDGVALKHRSVIPHLIAKDLRLNRLQIVLTVLVSLLALVVLQRGGEVKVVLGAVWFFVSIIVLGSMLPVSAIVNERKKQTLTFLMSLPVSPVQYVTAKVASTLLMFLVPWLALMTAAVVVIRTQNVLPPGALPMVFILGLLPLVGFCVTFSSALVGETEAWTMGATLICNSSYGVTWYLLARIPALGAHWSSRVPDWNATVLRTLSAEFGIIFLALGLAFYLQSRKRDFI